MRQGTIRAYFALLGVMATLSLAACGRLINIGGGEASSAFQITTNRDAYSRGNTGEITVRNRSDDRVEYNLCQRRLERRVDRSWITAFEWPTAGGSCTTEARPLPSGQSVNTLFEIPTGIPTGTYRIVFTGLLDQEGRPVTGDRAATPLFEVR